MKIMKIIALATLGLGVAACGSVDTVSRNAPIESTGFATTGQQIARDYAVADVNFFAADSLSVSEANGYYPMADVVWRGDPVGDRVEQVAAMFDVAMDRNLPKLVGGKSVVIDFELVRFHGVTERTRFSVGGVYNIVFNMTVRDAATGIVIEESRQIKADLAAPGGIAALMLEQRGQTEKVRVTDFLTQVFKDELTGTYDI